MRFSISLFLTLALISILGTVIEQDQSLEYYKINYPDDRSAIFWITWRQIISLGLNHVYSTYWFLFLLALFFLGLLVCTFSTQLPILKIARRWSFLYTQAGIKSRMHYSRLRYSSIVNMSFLLISKNYYVFHKGAAMYAYKGLTGRLAPIVVHAGIILTLTGSVFGFASGFMAQEMVPSGEVFHVQNFVKSGYFSYVSADLLVQVDDFFLTFNQDESVQQFFSDISLIDNCGNVFLKKALSVNQPLKFNGVTIYQTDWRIDALRVKIGSRNQLVKALNHRSLGAISNSRFWFCDLILDNGHKLSVLIPDLGDKLLIYNNHGVLIHVTRYGLRNIIYGVPIVFKDLMSSTGLQVKTDPGINFTYFGFLILMTSIMLSYTSYSQIWATKQESILHVSGETNRALLAFEDEIVLLCKRYDNLFQTTC